MNKATLRISLDPASVLYVRKIAERKRPIQTAIPIPGFTWDADRKRLPGVTDRSVAKQIMTALALAWRAMHGDADAAFVSLVKFEVTPDHFHFGMNCPHQKVLAPLAAKSERDMVAAHPDLADLGIRHKYALMDELCPIVFVWQHAGPEVLITNENHVGNPAQFLSIDRVGTTSGLLNFIGAFNLMLLQDDQETLEAMIPRLLKDAMDARADEWLRWLNHLTTQQVLFDPKRLFVDKNDPESYFYDYAGKPV